MIQCLAESSSKSIKAIQSMGAVSHYVHVYFVPKSAGEVLNGSTVFLYSSYMQVFHFVVILIHVHAAWFSVPSCATPLQ